MKKIFLALMCMASVAMFTACGGGNVNKKTADEKAETKAEAKAGLFDINDNQINAADENYYSTMKYLQGDERDAMLTKIPTNIKKAVGTVKQGFCVIQPSGSGSGYLFSVQLTVPNYADYKMLTDYYKSLGGTITTEGKYDTFSQLKIDYSWGRLHDCLYQEQSKGDPIIKVSFTINRIITNSQRI